MKPTGFTASLLALFCAVACAAADARSIPEPVTNHPGNIFLAGEKVTVQAPSGESADCLLVDYEGRILRTYSVANGQIILGNLGVGYYELRSEAGQRTNRVSIGVVERLRTPTPRSSPICADAALAWLVPPEQIGPVASLAALAGINWVRDRLNWPELEPTRGQFAQSNRYDFSLRAQCAAGLQLLDVTHISPAWANPTAKRFPLDLRDAYEYHRRIADRWRGEVGAFEPWNEADIDVFGGHTGSEMASLQKAAFLGLKAGNPKVIGCLNVFALHRRATLEDFAANEAWAYFDTFNLHHYEPFAGYPRLYADFRAVSAGRPLWVTECSLPVKWTGDPALQEPTWDDLRLQSERLVVTYALALHEQARAVFFFILPHFVEGQTQFGVLRRDLTPRPAFLAMAATGCLLADAQPLGRLKTDSDEVHAYAFRARPDGKAAVVLVLWADYERDLTLPAPAQAVYDHLGRNCRKPPATLRLTRAPLFVLLAQNRKLDLIPPPVSPPFLRGKPSTVVFQALLPEKTIVLDKSAYKIEAHERTEVPLFVYNFGSRPVRGVLSPQVPEGWRLELPPTAEVQPGDRLRVPCFLTSAVTNASEPVKVQLHGQFGSAGQPCLSLRFIVTPGFSR